MKLWSKEKTNTAQQIETFTVGNDRDFDLLMASHDVQGSIAHVTMLGEQGLMSKEDAEKAVKELQLILEEIKVGNFFAGGSEHNWFAGDLSNGQCRATASIAINLGQDYSVKAHALLKCECGSHGILTDHGIDNKENLIGLYCVSDASSLLHKFCIDA